MEAVAGVLGSDSSFFLRVSAASFVFFFLLFFISPAISKRLLQPYDGFTEAKKVNWDTRIGSNVHAVVVSLIALYCLVFDQETYVDPIWGKSDVLRCGISITHGYLIADFIIISLNYKSIGDVPTIIHHTVAIFSYLIPVIQGILLFFANVRQLAEISTPFVNLRWYYSASNTSHSSRRFVMNGMCMVFTFFLCRIATMPYYYNFAFRYWMYSDGHELVLVSPVVLITNSLALDTLNIYWMYKMVRGGLKILTNNNNDKAAKES